MPSVTIHSVRRANGKIYVRFGKIEHEFNSLQHMKECVRNQLNASDLKMFAIAMMLTRQPELDNPDIFAGRTLIVDLSSNSWGTVS